MKNVCRVFVFVSIYTAFSAVAHAGVYIGIQGGLNFQSKSGWKEYGSNSSLRYGDTPTSHSYSNTRNFEFDNGFNIGAVVGFKVAQMPVRVEGELFYQTNDIEKLMVKEHKTKSEAVYLDDFDFKQTNAGFLANLYYDFKNSTDFIPFISGGIGLSKLELTHGGDSYDDTVVSWQLGVGVTYNITDKILIDLKYRYYQTAEFKWSDFNSEPGLYYSEEYDEFDFSTHSILFGIRYVF